MVSQETKYKIVFFYPKQRANKNYSIEFLFETLRVEIAKYFKTESIFLRYTSNGFLRRILLGIEAKVKQGSINHITGDIHFITLFLKKNRTILTIHDCGFMNSKSRIARIIFNIFWLRLPVKKSKYVTVVSETMKQEVLGYVRCPENKIKVIPNFISPKFKRVDKYFNVYKPTILHIGTAANKNLERLIYALADIRCRLIIIGRLHHSYKLILNDNNIEYDNHFNLPEDSVIELYEKCDLLAFVSTYEGFGLPIIEAQTVGRPVVTSNISSMPEVADDSACLVNPYDIDSIKNGIRRVINDQCYRTELIRKGFINIRRYSIGNTTKYYKQLYNDMLNQK